MKIEYEPYHIGSKIKFYVDKITLISKLQNYYNGKFEDYEVNPNPFNRESFLIPTITILSNDIDKIFIQVNLSGNALNIIGNEPKTVYKAFETLLESLREVGYDLKSTFSFYEIITNIILTLEIEINPKDIFKKITLPKFTQIHNISDIMVNQIKFSNRFTLAESEERFEMEIYPNLTNPEHSIRLRILNRKLDPDKIKEVHNNIEDFIKDFYQKLLKD